MAQTGETTAASEPATSELEATTTAGEPKAATVAAGEEEAATMSTGEAAGELEAATAVGELKTATAATGESGATTAGAVEPAAATAAAGMPAATGEHVVATSAAGEPASTGGTTSTGEAVMASAAAGEFVASGNASSKPRPSSANGENEVAAWAAWASAGGDPSGTRGGDSSKSHVGPAESTSLRGGDGPPSGPAGEEETGPGLSSPAGEAARGERATAATCGGGAALSTPAALSAPAITASKEPVSDVESDGGINMGSNARASREETKEEAKREWSKGETASKGEMATAADARGAPSQVKPFEWWAPQLDTLAALGTAPPRRQTPPGTPPTPGSAPPRQRPPQGAHH